MLLYPAIIVISLILSFFFSGTETAFVALNKVRLEIWRRRRKQLANLILPFIRDPERFLYTTLIGNNIFNIAFASFATAYFNLYLEPGFTWLLIVCITLLAGEILPKTIFVSVADWVVGYLIYPLRFFYRLFTPLIWLVSRISELLLRWFGIARGQIVHVFSSSDIEHLLHLGKESVLRRDPIHGQFLDGVLNLKNLWVRDAMVPRSRMIMIPIEIERDDLVDIICQSGHSRLPVYSEDPENIIGYVASKDLFWEEKPLQELIRPVMLVPETKRAMELIGEFRESDASLAIVVDEYGAITGLVTTYDLVEHLYGGIEDPRNPKSKMMVQLKDNVWRVNAQVNIDDLRETIGEVLPEGPYSTVSGFMLDRLNHIPRRGESVLYGRAKLTVTSATRRRVEYVRLELRKDDW